ncbi:MAG: YceD family protein [Pseudomonadota bacterium]
MSLSANIPPADELERLIKVKGLPAEPVVIEADASERLALAKRFALPGIDTLHAEVDVEQRGTAIRASGILRAAIRQSCAISGEEFPAQIEEALDLRFVEKGTLDPAVDEDGEIEVELEADDCDEIEYSGDAFDLGEAVAQTLGLAIDPYAEGPGADEARKKAGIAREGEAEGALADMLRGLSKK